MSEWGMQYGVSHQATRTADHGKALWTKASATDSLTWGGLSPSLVKRLVWHVLPVAGV